VSHPVPYAARNRDCAGDGTSRNDLRGSSCGQNGLKVGGSDRGGAGDRQRVRTESAGDSGCI